MMFYSNLSFQEFQNLSEKYIPKLENENFPPLAYAGLSLCGEAGEVAEKLKRIYRGDTETKALGYESQIAKELADVLWCLTTVSTLLGYPLEDIAKMSLEKMEDRYRRGVLKGSGDNR